MVVNFYLIIFLLYWHRSDRKGPNLATFYYRHLDTDSEQESQKKVPALDAEVKSSESSEDEWTYSAIMKEVKKPELSVSLAEQTNSEEIKALVEKVNWSVSKNKHCDKQWISSSSSGVKGRNFRPENFDPEVIINIFIYMYVSTTNLTIFFSQNDEFIGDSCDASGEYTTEDDDQHFSSDYHSHSSRSCDITVVQATELDFPSISAHINGCSSPKVSFKILQYKINFILT